MERFARRMEWMEHLMAGNNTWEDRYRAKVAKRERGWNKEVVAAKSQTMAEK
jgi:hypothetical protein